LDAAYAPSAPKASDMPKWMQVGNQMVMPVAHAASAVLGGAAHAVGNLADVVTLTGPGKGSYADAFAAPFALPVTPDDHVTQAVTRGIGAATGAVSRGYDAAFGTGPAAQTVKERIPQALEAVGAVVPAARAFGIESTAAVGSRQSLGAASAAPDLTGVSPPLRQAVTKAVQNSGGNVTQELNDAITNHIEAEKHGVQLMEGQATRDPEKFSAEQNTTNPQIVKRINDQNTQMVDDLDRIRREAGPGTVQNNPIENGQLVVDDLKRADIPIRQDITNAYEAAKKASATGDLQMDGQSFVDSANAALKPQSKFRFLPSTVKGILDDVSEAGGKMNLDDFQAYQTQISAEIRKAQRAGDGNAVAAISRVQDALKSTAPMSGETAQAKALFDVAIGKARARFDAIDADPAYAAAVDESTGARPIKPGEPSPLADTFIDKYVLGKGAPKANVDNLMGKLSPEAKEAIASHTLGTIRNSAVGPNGIISPYGLNGALAKYGPKLDSLVSPATREDIEGLGRVVHNAKVAPAGHSVNYSKSGVIMNAAQGLGEAALNGKTLGLGVPIIKNIAASRAAARTLQPGAGLGKLSDLAK
jgi:hypothetical protein